MKPFDLSELSARIGAVSRRYAGNPNPRITLHDLSIDLAARRLLRAGKPVPLTAREWVLLEAFLQKPGQLLSKSRAGGTPLFLLTAKWKATRPRCNISRLRKKLGADIILTERGLGYRLAQT